jgi:AbrB family looped-hinge helix DNA binding protein
MRSTVSSKGQITIPAAIREALGLRPGSAVTFEPRPDGALLRRAVAARHPVDLVFGAAPMPEGTDALVDGLRAGKHRSRARVGRR